MKLLISTIIAFIVYAFITTMTNITIYDIISVFIFYFILNICISKYVKGYD